MVFVTFTSVVNGDCAFAKLGRGYMLNKNILQKEMRCNASFSIRLHLTQGSRICGGLRSPSASS